MKDFRLKMTTAAAAYLEGLKFENPETSKNLEQIESFYGKRLWHQLTKSVLEFVQRPDTQSKLIEFNAIVLKDIENRINHLQLVEIVIHCIRNVENMNW